MKFKTVLLFSICFILITSVKGQNVKSNNRDRIGFSYKIIQVDKDEKIYLLKGGLKNLSSDTLHFLSSSCYGVLSNFEFDNKNIKPKYDWFCNADNPTCIDILPLETKKVNIKFKSNNFKGDNKFIIELLDKRYSAEELIKLSLNNSIDYSFEDIILSKISFGINLP